MAKYPFRPLESTIPIYQIYLSNSRRVTLCIYREKGGNGLPEYNTTLYAEYFAPVNGGWTRAKHYKKQDLAQIVSFLQMAQMWIHQESTLDALFLSAWKKENAIEAEDLELAKSKPSKKAKF